MSNLNLNIVKRIPLLLPTLKDQKEIIHKIDKMFVLADNIEDRFIKAKEYIDKLPQTILGKVFRGELVRQDPNDEPAETLFKII